MLPVRDVVERLLVFHEAPGGDSVVIPESAILLDVFPNIPAAPGLKIRPAMVTWKPDSPRR